MNSLWIILPKSNEKIEVVVTRKKMKNVRLKVFRNLKVAISIPKNVSNAWTERYLNEKSVWIEEKLASFKKTTGYEAIKVIKNGVSIKILGREVLILIEQSSPKNVSRKEDTIIICTPNELNHKDIATQFDLWWKTEAKLYYESVLRKLYPIMQKYNCNEPSLKVRKMKTLWGSFSIGKDKMTINHYLYRASPPCVEYVILHELTHMLYPKHNKDFYNFLSIHMPDWKERKKILNFYLPSP